ncbi:MAG: ubiquinol-cytochrome c reductase cytochrome b subunit [Actinobacteria bacterium]|nr:ubiquinol-cytochrome c reductase cytochrome b subunit [Actinomycetota bacterium]
MLKKVARWIDNRLGTSAFTQDALNKVFPDHWSFMVGEIALYAFVVLIVTGIFLSFFFDASTSQSVYDGSYAPLVGVEVSDAYKSTLEISLDVRAGLVMRQTHHWAALVFVAAIVVHLCRIFFTGAFRSPRELNWIIGITLLILAIFNGFTGYSLPDDLLSGTGLRIAYSIALSVPLLGTWMGFLIFGGEFPADQIISRLLVTHIMIVPALIIGLLTAHLALLWRQKHTQFPEPGRTEHNVVGSKLWPTYAAKSLGLFFGVFAILVLMGGLFQINPIWLYGPFEPQQVSSPAQPDWYLGWVDGALRLFPAVELRAFGFEIPNPFYPGVLLPGVTFLALYAWPFLEQAFTHDREPHNLLDRPRDRPMRTALGATTLAFYTVMFIASSSDLIAKWFTVSVLDLVRVFQVLVILIPPAVGWATYRLMKALAGSGAPRLTEMPLSALTHPNGRGNGAFPHQERGRDAHAGGATAGDDGDGRSAARTGGDGALPAQRIDDRE